MPSGISDFGAEAWLDALFGVTEPITSYWLALLSDEPGNNMDGDILADLEPDDPDYARMAYGVGADKWASNGNYITNLDPVAYPLPGVDWGMVTHFALCDASISGDVYAWGEFLNPQYVLASYAVILPPGALVLTLTTADDSIAV